MFDYPFANFSPFKIVFRRKYSVRFEPMRVFDTCAEAKKWLDFVFNEFADKPIRKRKIVRIGRFNVGFEVAKNILDIDKNELTETPTGIVQAGVFEVPLIGALFIALNGLIFPVIVLKSTNSFITFSLICVFEVMRKFYHTKHVSAITIKAIMFAFTAIICLNQ